MPEPPRLLFINPWIHDFAAYDFWARPLGLFQLAAIARAMGCRVSYYDCLGRDTAPAGPDARQGRGPYRKTPLPVPPALSDVPRTWSRYGVPPETFRAGLAAMPRPDLVLVTSHMTYWYPGVFETISELRRVLPGVPVVLGGVYATLCVEHARKHSGADQVVPGQCENRLPDILERHTSWRPESSPDTSDLARLPFPALDLPKHLHFAPIITARGCPYRCAYCASHIVEPRSARRNPADVVKEIRHWHLRTGVRDFAFYDDALLHGAEEHAVPLFEQIAALGLPLRFHTPNAVHVRHVSATMARLFRDAGVRTLRLGVETTDIAHRKPLDTKVRGGDLARTAKNLRAAGFGRRTAGAYLLAGLPGQSDKEVEASILEVKAAGIQPIVAHYSPIPGTRLWDEAVRASRYDLASDPLFHNNAILPCGPEPFSWQRQRRLKQLALS
ncbi:MAG: B12-binding domain-containing radical SAM protein [Desulfatibacillaceae bacterium]